MKKSTNEEIIFKEIIENDYNIENFYSFLEQYRKSPKKDINEMSNSLIKRVITNFIEKEERENYLKSSEILSETISDLSEIEMEELKNGISTIFEKKDSNEIIDIISENQLNFNDFFKVENVKCEITDLKEKNLKKSFFKKKKQKVFSILTKPLDFKVERDFDDFLLLRKSLLKTYPFLLIPEIDDSKYKIMKKYPHKMNEKKNLEFFLEMIINNPYLKNSLQISSFLKNDKKNYLKTIKNCEIKSINENLKNFEKNNFRYKNKNFFRNLIKNIPSFKKSIHIINSKKIQNFNNQVSNYMKNYNKNEKKINLLFEKMKVYSKKILSCVNELLEKIKNLDILKNLGEKFNLNFTDKIINNNENLFNFMNMFKNDFEKNMDFLNCDLIRFFKFYSYENSKYLKFLQKKKQYFLKLKKIQNNFKKDEIDLNEKMEDIKIFKSYLNFNNQYVFKNFFVFKNLKINQFLDKNLDKDLDFYANVN